MPLRKPIRCWGEIFPSIFALSTDPRCRISYQTLFARIHREKLPPELAVSRPLKPTANNKAYPDETLSTKRCTQCGGLKPLSNFTKDCIERKGCRAQCKKCTRRMRQTSQYRLIKRKADLKANYNLTLVQYQALLTRQKGRCAVCGSKTSKSKRHKYLVVDHDHRTKQIRGLLCVKCNAAIGLLDDSTRRCLQFAKYLTEKPRCCD